MFSSSFIVHPFDQTEHFTNWVVILEQMHITQVNPFSLIKDTWPSDSRALVGSLLTTKLGCLDERTQEHVPKKEKKNQKKQRLCLWSIHIIKVYLYGLLCHLSMVFTQAAGVAHLQASSPVSGVVPSLREGNLSFCRWSLHPATLFPHPHRPSSPPIPSLLVFYGILCKPSCPFFTPGALGILHSPKGLCLPHFSPLSTHALHTSHIFPLLHLV